MKYIITENQYNTLLESSKDLEFIDNYWRETSKRLNNIIDKIKNELPIIYDTESIGDNLSLVNSSDGNDTWSGTNKSTSLEALANKIIHMIRTGKSDGIKRMLEKIATGRVKSLSKPGVYDSEFLGKGHFRWNWKAYTLTPKEIERVKEFFNL